MLQSPIADDLIMSYPSSIVAKLICIRRGQKYDVSELFKLVMGIVEKLPEFSTEVAYIGKEKPSIIEYLRRLETATRRRPDTPDCHAKRLS